MRFLCQVESRPLIASNIFFVPLRNEWRFNAPFSVTLFHYFQLLIDQWTQIQTPYSYFELTAINLISSVMKWYSGCLKRSHQPNSSNIMSLLPSILPNWLKISRVVQFEQLFSVYSAQIGTKTSLLDTNQMNSVTNWVSLN